MLAPDRTRLSFSLSRDKGVFAFTDYIAVVTPKAEKHAAGWFVVVFMTEFVQFFLAVWALHSQ